MANHKYPFWNNNAPADAYARTRAFTTCIAFEISPLPGSVYVDLPYFASGIAKISILPVRGGTVLDGLSYGRCLISIHPPRAGRDYDPESLRCGDVRFQSTLPVRGGTLAVHVKLSGYYDFNPPSPCGEGRVRQTSRR